MGLFISEKWSIINHCAGGWDYRSSCKLTGNCYGDEWDPLGDHGDNGPVAMGRGRSEMIRFHGGRQNYWPRRRRAGWRMSMATCGSSCRLTLSESRSGSSWHRRHRKDLGSRHSVCLVLMKYVPPTFSRTHFLPDFSPSPGELASFPARGPELCNSAITPPFPEMARRPGRANWGISASAPPSLRPWWTPDRPLSAAAERDVRGRGWTYVGDGVWGFTQMS